MTSEPARNSEGVARAIGFYRVIWRWHFYAGVFCVPFILALAVSGSIYLFKPQIDAWVDAPYRSLEVSARRGTPNRHIDVALQTVPGSRFWGYRLPESSDQAVIVSVIRNGERKLVYVDPFRLVPLKVTAYDDQPMRRVRSFHGELLAGAVGSIAVELAGCWTIVLLVTGLYLWWPRHATGLAGVLYPRLFAGGRVFWRDLHAVTGIWVSIGLLFFLISGLPWALVWGSAFTEIRSFAADLQQQDWSVSRSQERRTWHENAVDRVDLTPRLFESAMALRFAAPAELTVANSIRNTWLLKSDHQNRTLRAVAEIDGATGRVIETTTFDQRGLTDRVIGIAISIHEGQLFGWVNQALGLLVAAGSAVLAASGFILWWRRKPENRLGAPPGISAARVPRALAIGIIALTILLPMLAISLVVLQMFEWLVVRRVPAVTRWLGLA